ncbi:Homoprotocatechuate catabolism bifunctional isomerase/decarboxylase [compost metagenome]
MTEAPYKAPPKAPVLYVKAANTWSPHGSTVIVPAAVSDVEVGASIGMVFGAEGDIEGFVLLNDLSIPHASFFRPPVKFKCVDAFLGMGPALRDAQEVADPAQFRVEVRINGELKQSIDFSQLVRPAPQLLADVGEFMTLAHGDVLMLGCDLGRPLARAGDRIDISAPGFETLSNTLVKEATA